MATHYDNAYKYIFSNKRIFYQLLTSFVEEDFVKEIDIDHIDILDKSFVSDEFLSRESDVIYRIQFRDSEIYIYILLEFQSTVDKSIPVRMLLYIMGFYDLLLRNSQKGKLPSVFPMLLYNGNEDWTIPGNISDLIDNRIPAKYIPSLEYYRIVEKDIPDEVLFQLHNLISAIMYLEKRRDDAGLKEVIDKVVEMIKKENIIDIRMFAIWFKRMFRQNATAEEIEKINDIQEVKHMLTDIADQIMQKGIEQGIEQEKGKEKIQIAQIMKNKGFDIQTISEITGLPKDEIEKL